MNQIAQEIPIIDRLALGLALGATMWIGLRNRFQFARIDQISWLGGDIPIIALLLVVIPALGASVWFGYRNGFKVPSTDKNWWQNWWRNSKNHL